MSKIGDFKYQTFGLRVDWLELFLISGIDILRFSSLGPNQKDALYYYLKDMELIKNKKETTTFYDIISNIYKSEGIYSINLWSLLWINLYINSLLFCWYGTISLGKHSRKEIINYMIDSYRKMNRSILNGYSSLVGTLEKTPIGELLKLGRIVKEGSQRTIYKEGNFAFNPIIILYSIYKCVEKLCYINKNLVDLVDMNNDIYSPQKILCISTEQIRKEILSLYEPSFFTIIPSENSFFINLNENKSSLDVVNLYLMRRK